MTSMKVWHEVALDVEYEVEEGAPGKPNSVNVTGAYICGTSIVLTEDDIDAIEGDITDKLQEGYAPKTFWTPPISRGIA